LVQSRGRFLLNEEVVLMKLKTLGLGALTLLLCGVGSANATTVPVSPVSDLFTVSNPQGAVQYSASVTEANEIAGHLYYIPQSGLADSSQVSNPTYLTERGNVYSDEFGVFEVVQDGVLNYYLGFFSDTETGGLGSGTGEEGITKPEDGGTFDATMYLLPDLVDDGWTAQFKSDGDAVPEPGSLTLIVLGGAGLVGYGWRRRKVPVASR
jgi:hypothetical protein